MDLGAPDRARPAGGSLEAGVSPQAGRPAPGSWVPACIAREIVLGPLRASLRHAGRDRPFPGSSASTASKGQPCRRPLRTAKPKDRNRVKVVRCTPETLRPGTSSQLFYLGGRVQVSKCMPETASGAHVTPSVRRPRLPVVGASSRGVRTGGRACRSRAPPEGRKTGRRHKDEGREGLSPCHPCTWPRSPPCSSRSRPSS